jgi:ribosomal protein S18 acetylase RimI-like enzyme
VEPVHLKVLNNPEGAIIAPGGEVFFAVDGEKVVGTVAVRAVEAGRYELTKLGVDPSAQGSGIGRALCIAVIDWFLERGGKTLFLETHTKLGPAMRLYEKLGFEPATNPDAGGYAGTDCCMEWRAPGVVIHKATKPHDVAAMKELFRAYALWLGVDLCFQGFEEEMARFPVGYVHLLIAKKDGKPVGAVALKEHDKDTCEMKRLYLLPEAQGTGAGRAICERLMADAKTLGYKVMLLDSLRRLEAAVALYHKLGFEEIEPYNFNPEDDVVYMRRAL